MSSRRETFRSLFGGGKIVCSKIIYCCQSYDYFINKRINFRLHRLIHLDERRPRAFETFAGNFLCRVNAELAAAGDFARRVVEHVGRAFGEDAVALRIGVGREMEQHFAGVVDVHAGVHDDDVFREHHLVPMPQRPCMIL